MGSWAARAKDRLRRLPWWQVLLIGLAIRESFSFWTAHPYDSEIWIRTAYVTAHGLNPYVSFWPPVPGLSVFDAPLDPSAGYLPFWSLLLAGLYELYLGVGGGNPFVFYFLLKQPTILGDLGAGWLMYRLADRWTHDRPTALGVLWFWMLFPYTIVVAAIWGQFDSLELCVILGLLYVSTARDRAILNGIGIFIKWLTAIFLPFEFFRNRGWRRGWALVSIAIPFLLTLATFLALGWHFTGIQDTTFSESHGNGGGMNYARLLSDPAVIAAIFPRFPEFYYLISFAWVPAVIFTSWWLARHRNPTEPRGELLAITLILTVFLVTRFGLKEQYMVYLFGLLLLDSACFAPERRGFLTYLWVLSSIYFLINDFLGIYFLVPLGMGYYTSVTEFIAQTGFNEVQLLSLDLLSVVVTASLAQLAYLLVTQRTDWTPWILRPFANWWNRRKAATLGPRAETRVR